MDEIKDGLRDTIENTTELRLPPVGRKSTCRGCGAKIVWIETPSGKSMPCDATPVYYNLWSSNRDRVVTPVGVVIPCEIMSSPYRAHGIGFVPHWSTCPNAADFRKKDKP